MTIAMYPATSRNAHAHPQTALYDVVVLSADAPHNDPPFPSYPDPMHLLMEGLTGADRRAARFDYDSNSGPGAQARTLPDRMLGVAAKLNCLEDRLFELDGGAGFVRTYVSAARRAGRMTGLVCTNLPTTFFKRQQIIDVFEGEFDFVVGKPVAVLSLFGFKRIDSLIPRLIHRGADIVLHRVGHPSLFMRPGSTNPRIGEAPISRDTFWSQFVPSALDSFVDPTPA